MTETSKLARPRRIRLSLWDDAAGATPIGLPAQSMWPLNLIVAIMFALFAGVEWLTIAEVAGQDVRNVFDLMFVLFQGFWVLGWSVTVVILGALTVFFFFYTESVRLQDRRLVHVPRLGPLKIIIEYDLARVRNVHLEKTDNPHEALIRFDDDAGSHGLGNVMARSDAERLVDMIRRAAAAAGATDTPPAASTPEAPAPRAEPVAARTRAPELPPPSMTSPSGLALIAANLVPLGGVLFFGWDLASVIVLYWAESAVIGFYTALKMAIVGKFAALFAVPFFVGHFGGFMALHFLFIYSFFVRGPNPAGVVPGVRDALVGVFIPVWLSLAALFISHGISFFSNFIGRHEYDDATIKGLMTAPYNRIVVMQITVILGGGTILLLKSPAPSLALLVLLKTAVDFSGHRKEHRAYVFIVDRKKDAIKYK